MDASPWIIKLETQWDIFWYYDGRSRSYEEGSNKGEGGSIRTKNCSFSPWRLEPRMSAACSKCSEGRKLKSKNAQQQ